MGDTLLFNHNHKNFRGGDVFEPDLLKKKSNESQCLVNFSVFIIFFMMITTTGPAQVNLAVLGQIGLNINTWGHGQLINKK